jgi:hypothetical protein
MLDRNKKSISLLIFFFSIALIGCNSNLEGLTIENNKLKNKNDSLSSIVEEISNMYVFDSIAFRDIYSKKNTYKKNSEFEIEFMVVAFSSNKSYFVKYDSINNITGKYFNADTLIQKNGGFKLKTKLTENENPIWVKMNIENKYGKTEKGVLYDKIKIKDNN